MPFRRLLLAAIATLAYAAAASAQSAPPELDTFSGDNMTLEIWDRSIELLREEAWEVPGRHDKTLKDSRGRTISDDIEEQILAEKTVARLDVLRKEAGAKANDAAALQPLLDEAKTILLRQTYALLAINMYWWARSPLEPHAKALEPWLAGADEADREAVRLHLTTTDQAMLKGYHETLQQTDLEAVMQRLGEIKQMRRRAVDFYNERRKSFILQQVTLTPLAEAQSQTEPPTRFRARQSPCPPPAQPNGAAERPGFDPKNAAPETFYPPFAKQNELEGDVVIRARISATGCMERAEIGRTSGIEELDDSAMLWSEGASFTPGVKDGKAAGGVIQFRVKFELKE